MAASLAVSTLSASPCALAESRCSRISAPSEPRRRWFGDTAMSPIPLTGRVTPGATVISNGKTAAAATRCGSSMVRKPSGRASSAFAAMVAGLIVIP